jgi:hypothetical protein
MAGFMSSIFAPRQYEKEDILVLDHDNSTLFGKIEDISLKISGIEWEIPDESYGPSNFDACAIIDFTEEGTITFLQTNYHNKQDPDVIKEIEQYKIYEIIQLVTAFDLILPPYCIVYQNITNNKANRFNVDQKGATIPRYHIDGQVTYFLKDDAIIRSIISTRPPEHLFLRYIGDSCASTTIKGIFPNEEYRQQNDAYRFEVKANDAIYLRNDLLHHSTPYIQENVSICRDNGNELSRKITENPRIIERTLIQTISPEEYTRLIVNVKISETYKLSKAVFDSYRHKTPKLRYNVDEYTQNATIRARLECGGSKSKKRKFKKPASKKSKKRRASARKQHSKI